MHDVYICVCIFSYVHVLWNHNPPGETEEPTVTTTITYRNRTVVVQYDDPDAEGYRDPKTLEYVD